MIALGRAILMKADPVVSLHAHRLFSGRACSCKKDPCSVYVAIAVTILFWKNLKQVTPHAYINRAVVALVRAYLHDRRFTTVCVSIAGSLICLISRYIVLS